MKFMKSFTKWKILVCLLICISSLTSYAAGTDKRKLGISSEEAFDNPGLYPAKQLFELAKNALKGKKYDDARLYALRIFFDGFRSKSLLNLLGIVEVNDGRPLLASIWFRKSLSLGIRNRLAQRYLARLPGKIRPIPVDPTRLAEHFTKITEELPKLLERLSNSKLHFNAIMKSLQRGQIYKALALAEEYEKKYPGPDGASLTALCAWKLGRNKDAIQIVKNNLSKAPYHPLLLFVKAVIEDTHPGTSSPSYFRALYDLDKWAKALKNVKEFEKTFPGLSDALVVKGRIMLDMHKLPEARKALEKASIKEPGNPEIDLLWVEYFLQNNNSDRASRKLTRAFRRGYNLPSVSLTAGLFALQGGRSNEVNVILNDARTGRPFTDPDAYPLYITLLLMNDQTIEARDAIDEWSDRTLKRSMYCYLESLYCFKTGDNRKALSWLRKGFDMNPNRLGILEFIYGFPAVGDDPALAAMINNRLAQAGLQNYSRKPVPDSQVSYDDPLEQNDGNNRPRPSDSSSTTEGEGVFQITLGSGISPNARSIIAEELNAMYERISSYIGSVNVPIFVNFVSADGMGATIALYEPQNTGITVTSIYYDADMIRNIIRSNFDALGEEEMGLLIEELPGHTLAKELTHLIVQIIIPDAKTDFHKTAWLQIGLAEILGGSRIVQRYRLLIADRSINKEVAKLTSPEMLNSIFSEGYSSPSVLHTATAQAYLMTSVLVKKSGNLAEGCKDIMQMIELMSNDIPLDQALNQVCNISAEEFEKEWKESAYWAIKQGLPYEWE
ncbi:MAG: tetratricopeptide repeat protein [Candidatus Rifleibacteriota bacterium]